jgi:hypothetical protein
LLLLLFPFISIFLMVWNYEYKNIKKIENSFFFFYFFILMIYFISS